MSGGRRRHERRLVVGFFVRKDPLHPGPGDTGFHKGPLPVDTRPPRCVSRWLARHIHFLGAPPHVLHLVNPGKGHPSLGHGPLRTDPAWGSEWDRVLWPWVLGTR